MGIDVIDYMTYDSHVKELDKLAADIVQSKRKVYTNGNRDVFRNFRLNAALANGTLGQQLGFGLVKQVTAIIDILNDPKCADSEKCTRFADAINYLKLGYVAYQTDQLHEKYL